MKPINLLVGGLTLFTAQGCKAPKQVVEQSEHPNIIYVFRTSTVIRQWASGVRMDSGIK